jgi:hypothetical protein
MMVLKTVRKSHETLHFKRMGIRMEEVGKKAGDLAHHPARNSAG